MRASVRRQGRQGPGYDLPSAIDLRLTAHLERVRKLHAADLAASFARVVLSNALARKYPQANREGSGSVSFCLDHLG